jgi:hypothetical protein
VTAAGSVDGLTERLVSVSRELTQYRVSFALVCETVLSAVAQYPVGATRAVLLSELLERAVSVSEQQLLTSARALAFTAHCTFDVVAHTRVAAAAADDADDTVGMRLLLLRVARDDAAANAAVDLDLDEHDGFAAGAAASLLRFVASRKHVPLLAHSRTLLMTGLHFGVHDARLLLPTRGVVPLVDSLAFLAAEPFRRQRLSLLQLLAENDDAAAPTVLVAPAFYLKCDVVRADDAAGASLAVSDGTLDSADGVLLTLADASNPVLSLLRVGDTIVLLDCAFRSGRLIYLDDRTVLVRMRERREPLLAAAASLASGSAAALFGSPAPSGSGATASGAPLLSPSGGAPRNVPRNARGELDYEHLNRVTNLRDLRRNHVNVSLVALAANVARSRDARYPLVLRLRDSFGAADVHVSAKLAPPALTLLGGEMLFLQNVCAVAVAGKPRPMFVLDDAVLNTKLVVVSLISSILATPSLCKPHPLAWLLKRSRSQRARAPLAHVAVAARVAALRGTARGDACTVAAHAVCERVVAFVPAQGMQCGACARSVLQSEIVPTYALECALVDAEGGDERLVCALRNNAAYRMLGATAAQYERLDENEREQLLAAALGKRYAMFVVAQSDDLLRIDSVTALHDQ